MITLKVISSLAAFSLIYLFSRLYRRRSISGSSLPPGPKKLPLIGNLLDMPKSFEWKTYEKWGKDFDSDIIHVDIVGTSIIVLNTAEAATDLLEKRSSIYSNRVRLPMVNELMGWSFLISFMPYGPYWREHRRVFNEEFHRAATLRYRPHELKATSDFLRRLLDTPEYFMDHLRHLTGATIMSITYGIDVLPSDDPYIEVAMKAVHPLTIAGVPGAFLVDSIPILKYVPEWLPGAGFQRKAKLWRSWAQKMLEMPFDATKRNIANGDATPSFVSFCLEKVDESGDIPHQEQIIKQTAGTMYAGGTDTTVSSFGTFVLAMLSNPEAQLKAQKELDSVLGGARLPDFDDQESLPYVTALVKETLRWKNVTPIALPHSVTVDDVYKGYRIPVGSIVIPNVWAMLHDENTYPDHASFKPERFLKDGELNPDAPDPTTVAFGFGRRKCPGRYMAIDSVWIGIASILTTFDITKAVDENGSVVEPSYEVQSSLVSYPLPFKCSIKPRSKEAELLIRATAKLETL